MTFPNELRTISEDMEVDMNEIEELQVSHRLAMHVSLKKLICAYNLMYRKLAEGLLA